MKRVTLTITILILAVILSACSLGGETREPARRLTVDDFPTPVPAQPSATPTAFPKSGLALVTPSAEKRAPESTPTATAASVTPAPTATPAPFASGTVASSGLNVRDGIGLSANIVEELRQGDSVTILVRDDASGWVNVRTPSGTVGWVNSKYLNVSDDLSGLHGISAPPATAAPASSNEMKKPATAVVTAYALNVRNSAGDVILEEIHQGDTVEVLRKSDVTGWLNVRTASGTEGWASPEYLVVSGDIPGVENGISSVTSVSSSAGGRLLIQLQRGGDIVMLNRDGSNLHTLTTGIDPALSPNGGRVAFSRWQGAEGTLWVINTDGTNEYPVRGEIRQVKNPSWSPDSTQIAVNFQQGGTSAPTQQCANLALGQPNINYWQAYDITQEIRIMGGQPVPFLCWWMPADPHWKLRIINIADGTFEDKPAGEYASNPVWDPANPWRVVSRTENGLVQTDVNQGTASPLTNDVSDHAPVFSPDGKFIALTYRQDTHWDIHRINGDGSGRVRLTETPFYITAVNDVPPWNNVSPVFSPDGAEIAFLTDRNGRWEVWVMNADGSNQRPMFSDAVNDRLPIEFSGADEHPLGWGK